MDIDNNEITLNTGNIGYRVYLGEGRILKMNIQKDSEIELVVHTAVREDEIRLFGFESFLSRSVFESLLTVNGIGPKAAMSVLDRLEPQTVIEAIFSNDFTPFLNVSGIGKKTAQRIVLDLQGKIEKISSIAYEPSLISEHQSDNNSHEQIKLMNDAKSALLNLGYPGKTAEKVVRKHIGSNMTLDEIIRKSLSELHQ